MTTIDLDALQADVRARWRPSEQQIALAVTELAANPHGEAWLAAVPLVMPGKEHGVWTLGQPVEHVEGVVFLGRNSFDAGASSSYAEARNFAADAARKALGDRPGTVGWATIYSDGGWSVFEDFGS